MLCAPALCFPRTQHKAEIRDLHCYGKNGSAYSMSLPLCARRWRRRSCLNRGYLALVDKNYTAFQTDNVYLHHTASH
jgi:hypothetical protein